MLVGDLDSNLLRAAGGVLGIALGVGGIKVVDRLPTTRYGINHVATGQKRSRRNTILLMLTTLCTIGIAHVLTRAPDASVLHGVFLLVTNAIVATSVLAAAAIDLEHLILPNELTIGMAALCILTSPLRAVGIVSALEGAVLGLVLMYLPFAALKKLRGGEESSMGLGDAKLAIMAGAWHGIEGVVFVLFAAGMQSLIVALVMRTLGIRFEVPASVKAELAALRARADAGDEEAKRELADDPMSAERDDALGMRLPFGPFLALGCVEVLFVRRWLIDHALAWFTR